MDERESTPAAQYLRMSTEHQHQLGVSPFREKALFCSGPRPNRNFATKGMVFTHRRFS